MRFSRSGVFFTGSSDIVATPEICSQRSRLFIELISQLIQATRRFVVNQTRSGFLKSKSRFNILWLGDVGGRAAARFLAEAGCAKIFTEQMSVRYRPPGLA